MIKHTKKIIAGLMAALILVCGANTIAFAATSRGYSGTVKKYADFESGLVTKGDASEYATNNAKSLPSGTYDTWAETRGGANMTYKTAYNSAGKYHMLYKETYDTNECCAYNIYVQKGKLKLNISTVLTNFNSGSVSGTWSPDTF